jgi:hypothetical protein
MILKTFSPKKLAGFFALNTASLCNIWIMTLVAEKNANFLQKIGKNCKKL